MIGNNITIIVVFILYLLMMLVIGIVAFKRTSNTADYYLGGRSLGKWVVSISAQASDMSGWLLMGATWGCIFIWTRSWMDRCRFSHRDLFKLEICC